MPLKTAINIQTVPERDKTGDRERIKTWLARQIWRMEGYYEVSNSDDAAI